MHRHEFLRQLHALYQPRTYLEVGVFDGKGLSLSRTPTIGVDPDFRITHEVKCDLQLVRATSDDFFARPDATEHFGNLPVDLTFIDGMHLAEFALRDFVNAERLSARTSVVVFDDMLPRSVDEAARDRHTMDWAGDVYKVALALARLRPDLVVLPVDTRPTGVVVVVNLDPSNTVVGDAVSDLTREFVVPDPQQVPDAVLHRTDAVDAEKLLALPLWNDLRQARDGGGASVNVDEARTLLGSASFTPSTPNARPWPPRKQAAPPRPAAAGTTRPAPGSGADLARSAKGFARSAALFGRAAVRRARTQAANRRS